MQQPFVELWTRIQNPQENEHESKTAPPISSWADLVRKKSTQRPSITATTAPNKGTDGYGLVNGDRKYKTLEEALDNWDVTFAPPPVLPRGLVNTGNMCFMNVVLQALLYCGPFYNLLWNIKGNVAFSFNTATPLLEALIQYIQEFRRDPTPMEQMISSSLDEPFIPENVYEALKQKNVFKTLRGQQEDAQEFMNYLVGGIHEEMAIIMQCHQASKTKRERGNASATADTDSSGWLEVGLHNKPMYIQNVIHESDVRTPITQIFGGTTQSALAVPNYSASSLSGSKREPFQWLGLDVTSDSVFSIEDALDELLAPEPIEGYMDIRGVPATATKQVLLESMPPVLVLHLKRFEFCPNVGAQKVQKFIEYPAVLSMSPKWFAKTAQARQHRDAQYRLTGVIYHHGIDVSGGHYTCDLLRSSNEWLRFDDGDIKCLRSVHDALDEKEQRAAYILFYTIDH